MKNIPDLLQVAEVANADADFTADASKTKKKDNDVNISEK